MAPARIATTAAGLHVLLVGAAVYYTTRVNNDVALSEISARELAVMCGMALLPVMSAWIGLRLARSGVALWLLAIGQTVALVLFAATFVSVLRSAEGMAPLLFLLVSMWLAAGLAVLLIVLWLAGRRGR
ncbi:MAG: hypothetical protein JNN24_05925 [Hyphomicrobium zavarzinii]|jgi:hypothetical protein|uniref:hypothetical protein n=1 Tax=Hyphomicrobium zavarzinii TaxID=48292 RepID=UPI001A563778|nr:hypothetical protein [Hyphomicrobium zavarzinii]MBL8845291.1 hypothetical protein [Hyphomicrobium zavarzinii]